MEHIIGRVKMYGLMYRWSVTHLRGPDNSPLIACCQFFSSSSRTFICSSSRADVKGQRSDGVLIITHLSCEEWPHLSASVVSPRPHPLSSSSPPLSPFAGPLSVSLAAAHPASPAGGGAKTPQGRGYLLSLPPLAVP